MHARDRVLLLSLIALMGGCATTPTPRSRSAMADPSVMRGHSVAERLCSRCHEVEPGAGSHDISAPPFTKLWGRYSTLGLEDVLDRIGHQQHRTMPSVSLSRDDALSIAAYIESLSDGATSP